MVDELHKVGEDVPEKYKRQLKDSPIGAQLNIENKMSVREKQKAQQRATEDMEAEFTAKTGIQNKSKFMNLEHLMAKFKYDMKVIQKKQRMLREGRDDVDFEEMDAELSEGDAYNDAESLKFKEFL